MKSGQAAHTFGGDCCSHGCLDKQTLCGARHSHLPIEIQQVEIWQQANGRDVKWEIAAVTNGLVDDKTDVEPQEV